MKRLLKSLVLSCALCTMFYVLPRPIAAQQEFKTSFNTTYTVKSSGDADVSQEITLSNNFSTVYATSYSLSLEGKKPTGVRAVQDGKTIPVQIDQTDQNTKISISFPEAVVGKGKTRKFAVLYSVPHLALQNGQVWELLIPRISSVENFDSYNLTINIPQSLGKLAYISPQPKNQTEAENMRTYYFTKEDLTAAGVVAAFGNFQVFTFNLTYHLKNPYHDRSGKTDIALVPDTAFQRVYYSKISPNPEKVYLDLDGNWLATYYLKSGEQRDIRVEVSIQLFAQPQSRYPKVDPDTLAYYLSSSPYWQTQSEEVTQAVQSLGSHTPRAIYDYTVKTLTYDYSRVSENVERLGAVRALKSPHQAICTEFTDVFVTLARSLNIPAREINGYAYTENPQIQPLSLVADILHAWPEYWDSNKKIWRPVDPTWGNTTGGVDYFDKFDLSHITFAIHGKNPDLPPAAGSYKLKNTAERDVSVSFGQLPDARESTPEIKITQSRALLPFIENKIHVKIYNPGPVALYEQKIFLETYGVKVKSLPPGNVSFIAPFQSLDFDISYTLPLISKTKSSTIRVAVGDYKTALLSQTSYKSTFEIPAASFGLLQAASAFGILLVIILTFYVAPKYLPTLVKKYVQSFKESSRGRK